MASDEESTFAARQTLSRICSRIEPVRTTLQLQKTLNVKESIDRDDGHGRKGQTGEPLNTQGAQREDEPGHMTETCRGIRERKPLHKKSDENPRNL